MEFLLRDGLELRDIRFQEASRASHPIEHHANVTNRFLHRPSPLSWNSIEGTEDALRPQRSRQRPHESGARMRFARDPILKSPPLPAHLLFNAGRRPLPEPGRCEYVSMAHCPQEAHYDFTRMA